jgi:hypothetical protein
MTNDNGLIHLDRRISQPAIVLYLIDDFTLEGVAGGVQLALQGQEIKPVRNRSGYYLFINLAPGKYRYSIESEHFERVEDGVTVWKNNIPPEPIPINLIPRPSYPFPHGVTLIRGTILEETTRNPIKDVKVGLKLKGKEVAAKTADDGQFVIYLPRLKAGMWKKVNGEVLVKADDETTDFTAEFTRNGYQDGKMFLTAEGTVKESKTFTVAVGKEVILIKYLKEGGP